MIRNCLIVLLLFVLHEGLYFLPEKAVVIPGVFRMSDALFVVFPFFAVTVRRTFSRYREESLIVVSFCALVFLSCLVGQFFWPQTYMQGLLNIRKNLFWLSFFLYVLLIRDIKEVEKLLKLLTGLAGIYVTLLILTKYFPNMGIIHFSERFYSKSAGTMRFGEHRLFFPYGTIPIMLYCIALARLLYGPSGKGFGKMFLVVFILIVWYAILSSFTRGIVYPLVIATVFALFRGGRRSVRFTAFGAMAVLACVYVLSVAVNEGGGKAFEETKVGKLIFNAGSLEPERGREIQALMYLRGFERSPLTGVGTFAVRGTGGRAEEVDAIAYRKYGFFDAVDLGYLKILGENGLLGIAWVIWWYSYFFRRAKQTLRAAKMLGNMPFVEAFCQGVLYLMVYLLISGVTLGHWIHPNMITILPLLLALMAVTRVSVNRIATASGKASVPQYSR